MPRALASSLPSAVEWSHRLMRDHIKPGDWVADVGAYRGEYSVVAAHRAGANGRVFAFEPTAANAQFVHRNAALNNLSDRITVAQNVVSILYREFKDDTARPAFSLDLKYDLTESKVVGYRGARFEIIKATNQGLTYKTLKQLD